MDSYARVKETFQQVIMPLLKVEAPRFPDDSEFSAFAIEVSHHVHERKCRRVAAARSLN